MGGNTILQIVVLVISCIVVGLISGLIAWKKGNKKGYEKRKTEAEAIFNGAEAEGKRIVAEAVKVGEAKKREYLLATKEEIHKSKLELEKEIKDRRNEMQRSERRLIQKEESIDKKQQSLEEKEALLNNRFEDVKVIEANAKAEFEKQIAELERISGFSREEAKQYLLSNLENEITHESAAIIRECEAKLKEDADRKAKEIIATAI